MHSVSAGWREYTGVCAALDYGNFSVFIKGHMFCTCSGLFKITQGYFCCIFGNFCWFTLMRPLFKNPITWIGRCFYPRPAHSVRSHNLDFPFVYSAFACGMFSQHCIVAWQVAAQQYCLWTWTFSQPCWGLPGDVGALYGSAHLDGGWRGMAVVWNIHKGFYSQPSFRLVTSVFKRKKKKSSTLSV